MPKKKKKKNCASAKAKPEAVDCAKRGFGHRVRVDPTNAPAVVAGHDEAAWSESLPASDEAARIDRAKGPKGILTDPVTGRTLGCVILETAQASLTRPFLATRHTAMFSPLISRHVSH